MNRLMLMALGIGLVLSSASIVQAEGLAGAAPQMLTGKVDQINRAAKTITVDPGPLEPAKEFQLSDRAQLPALKQGDEVSVQFSEQNGQAVAEEIKLVKAEGSEAAKPAAPEPLY